MRKIISFLFPWQKTFDRLQLEKHWWHRLAIVLFCVALPLTFLFTWASGYSANQPAHTVIQRVHHWCIGTDGYPFDLDLYQPLDTMAAHPPIAAKSIEMPDGTTARYSFRRSDEAIEIEWYHKLHTTQAKIALGTFGVALLLTALLSYLLQGIYRAALYVIYGVKVGAASDDSAAVQAVVQSNDASAME